MRKLSIVFAAAVLIAALPGMGQNRSRSNSDKIVVVFKDGHRQSFNLADVARIEFPGGSSLADSGRLLRVPRRADIT
jgi:hypothetical protein